MQARLHGCWASICSLHAKHLALVWADFVELFAAILKVKCLNGIHPKVLEGLSSYVTFSGLLTHVRHCRRSILKPDDLG